MLQRRLDVEGHDVRCVKLLQALEILGSESFDYLVDLLPNLGFVYLALRRHRYPSLPFGVKSWLLTSTTTQHGVVGLSGRKFSLSPEWQVSWVSGLEQQPLGQWR